MGNLCFFILVSFLLMSAYCSDENSTGIEKNQKKSLKPGDAIQVQNLFVASCENIKEDLNSVKTSLTYQNKQMQGMVKSVEEVYNVANETKPNVIKQNTLLRNLVGSVESFNSSLVAQKGQIENISKTLKVQGEQLQTLTAQMTEFVSKKNEEIAIRLMSCPVYFEELKDKCYRFHGEKKTWSEASGKCQEDGSFLAEPRSELENDFIIDIANREGESTILLGGTDQRKDGEWRWATNNDIISGFTNWYDGKDEDLNNQPRDHIGNEDCVLAIVKDVKDYMGKWFARDCTERRSFVCQTVKVSSVQQTNQA